MKAENYFKSALKENRPSLKKRPPLFDFCRFFDFYSALQKGWRSLIWPILKTNKTKQTLS